MARAHSPLWDVGRGALLLLLSAGACCAFQNHAAGRFLEVESRASLAGLNKWRPTTLYSARAARGLRRGVQLLRAAAMRVNVGDSVEVRWQGEWWPAVVQELGESRCGGGSGDGSVESVRVQFQGGTDEEWMKLASGDVRPVGDYAAQREASTQETSQAAYWLEAGAANCDFSRSQAELLEELLEYRLQPGANILELGAGAKSFVPVERVDRMMGIGLVPEHMQRNPLLNSFEVMDLNTPNLTAAFGLEEAKFDAVVCNYVPYLVDLAQVVREARKCVKDDGFIAMSWSSKSLHEQQVVPTWQAATGSEQVSAMKALFSSVGLNAQSLRVDVSGPTDGDKLFVLSASPSPPKAKEASDTLKVRDAVGPHQLLHALKDKSKKRKDARRQKEHDEKPFKVKVVSPPPEKLLDDVFHLHPRTHNGDKIDVYGDQYVVSRTVSSYSYRQGRYRLDSKLLEVQKTSRYETNEKLNSLVSKKP